MVEAFLARWDNSLPTTATTTAAATTAAGMAHKKVSEFGSLLLYQLYLPTSVTRKKSPNVYKMAQK